MANVQFTCCWLPFLERSTFRAVYIWGLILTIINRLYVKTGIFSKGTELDADLDF